jgi:hypothetical protein
MSSFQILIILLHYRFTAMARATFGLYGSYLPVMLLVFENVIFVSHHIKKLPVALIG